MELGFVVCHTGRIARTWGRARDVLLARTNTNAPGEIWRMKVISSPPIPPRSLFNVLHVPLAC